MKQVFVKFTYSLLVSIFLLLTCVFSTYATVTNLVATVDKNPVMLDESIQLVVTATGDVDNTDLNLSVLDRDFNRSRTSISRSTQMINFNTTKTTTWSTQLFPRDTGRFTIPAFEIDGQRTEPFDVLVVPVSSGQGQQAREFYVTATLDKKNVYLQQQLKYTVKIYLAKDIQRGSLQAPELDGAVIEPLGEDKEYQEIQNGVRYRVIERTFAIIPQSSGTFSISAPIFQGEILTETRQGFGIFNRSKSISRSGPRQEITVKPIPSTYTDHWLPSEFVQLNEEWLGDTEKFVVGEPVTRTLTLTAAGLVEEQLPNINASYPPQFKVYPDQANTATVDKDSMLFAQRIENTAVIPNRAGTYVLPEVVVPWFNVITETTEYAKLPARSVNVLPAAQGAQNSEPTISDSGENNVLDGTQQQSNALGENQNNAPNNAPLNSQTGELDWLHWVLITLNLLFMAIVASWVMFKNKTTTVPNGNNKTLVEDIDEAAAWASLQEALRANNIPVIQSTLLLWLQRASHSNHHSAINILESLNAPEIIEQYNAMQASRYASNASITDTSTQDAKFDIKQMSGLLGKLRIAIKDKENTKTASQRLYS